MITQEELDLIHKYLEDDLSPEEIEIFKNTFNTNKEFAKEVKQYTDIRIALKATSAAGLQAKKKKKAVLFSKATLAYAAMFLILLGVGSLLYLQFGTMQLHEKLYAQNFQNPFSTNNEWLTRSDLSETETAAIQEFKKALDYMEQNDYDKAAVILKTFNYDQHAFLMPDVEWFLALSFLQTGKIDDAKALLELVQSSNSEYREKAGKIYEELN